jgi:hypothetical protein
MAVLTRFLLPVLPQFFKQNEAVSTFGTASFVIVYFTKKQYLSVTTNKSITITKTVFKVLNSNQNHAISR